MYCLDGIPGYITFDAYANVLGYNLALLLHDKTAATVVRRRAVLAAKLNNFSLQGSHSLFLSHANANTTKPTPDVRIGARKAVTLF